MASEALVLVREMLPRDAAAVAAIYNEGIAGRQATFETRPRTASEVARWLEEAPAFPVLVAERSARVVGWARVTRYSERPAYAGVGECAVYVSADARGAAVGRRLLEALVHVAAGTGFWKLTGRLFATNEASIRLMRACGFREVGMHLRHARLDDEWRDVLLVERWLGPV